METISENNNPIIENQTPDVFNYEYGIETSWKEAIAKGYVEEKRGAKNSESIKNN